MRIQVFMDLPHCIRSALKDYENITNGETEFFLENLIAVSFLLPESSFHPVGSRKDLKLIDSPLAKALLIMTSAKNIDESEISVERIKRKVSKKNDSVWNLVRCANPLLKERCTEECEYYRFRHTFPEVIRRKVDKRTGEVKEALIRVEGEEFKADGKVLSSFKKFSDYLEKRGYLLPKISVEWLYQGITKFSEREFADIQAEEFRDQLSEILAELGEYFIDKFDGKNIWVSGKKFMELLKTTGHGAKGTNVKEIRREYGFGVKRTRDGNYTLIPLSFLCDEDREVILLKMIRIMEDFFAAENIEVEIKERITDDDRMDEEYILGRKAYISLSSGRLLVSFSGQEKVFEDPSSLRAWIRQVKENATNDEELINL